MTDWAEKDLEKQEAEQAKKAEENITWTCRFHPTDWFHELGCPHREWTKEEYKSALHSKKIGEQLMLEALKQAKLEGRREENERAKEYLKKICWDEKSIQMFTDWNGHLASGIVTGKH